MGSRSTGMSLIIKPMPDVSALNRGRPRTSRYRLSRKKKIG
jgi:hypothetical protein